MKSAFVFLCLLVVPSFASAFELLYNLREGMSFREAEQALVDEGFAPVTKSSEHAFFLRGLGTGNQESRILLFCRGGLVSVAWDQEGDFNDFYEIVAKLRGKHGEGSRSIHKLKGTPFLTETYTWTVRDGFISASVTKIAGQAQPSINLSRTARNPCKSPK